MWLTTTPVQSVRRTAANACLLKSLDKCQEENESKDAKTLQQHQRPVCLKAKICFSQAIMIQQVHLGYVLGYHSLGFGGEVNSV